MDTLLFVGQSLVEERFVNLKRGGTDFDFAVKRTVEGAQQINVEHQYDRNDTGHAQLQAHITNAEKKSKEDN